LTTEPLKLKYDEPLSNFAFISNLRHYVMDWQGGDTFDLAITLCSLLLVGRCKLKPMFVHTKLGIIGDSVSDSQV
jgi:hypothetical protein